MYGPLLESTRQRCPQEAAGEGGQRENFDVGQFSADGSAVDLGAMWRFSRVTRVSVFNMICTRDFPH